MKKTISLMVLAVALAVGVSAEGLTLSAGAGFYFSGMFGGGMKGDGTASYDAGVHIPSPGTLPAGDMVLNTKSDLEFTDDFLGFGGFVFFDATYAELDIAFMAGPATTRSKRTTKGSFNSIPFGYDSIADQLLSALADEPQANYDLKYEGSFMAMDFSLLGKFPITLSEKLTIFPLLGVNYTLMLSVKTEYEEGSKKHSEKVYDGLDSNRNEKYKEIAAIDYSILGFRAGVGVDFSLSEKLYLRGEALFGLGLPGQVAKTRGDALTKEMEDENGKAGDGEAKLPIGPTVKLAVGYRFVTL